MDRIEILIKDLKSECVYLLCTHYTEQLAAIAFSKLGMLTEVSKILDDLFHRVVLIAHEN